MGVPLSYIPDERCLSRRIKQVGSICHLWGGQVGDPPPSHPPYRGSSRIERTGMLLAVRHRTQYKHLMTGRQQGRLPSQSQDGPPSRTSLYRRSKLLALHSGGWRTQPQQHREQERWYRGWQLWMWLRDPWLQDTEAYSPAWCSSRSIGRELRG